MELNGKAAGSRGIMRGVALLDTLAEARAGLGVSELSRRARLSKSTTHHIANTLVAAGLLRFDHESKRYHLGAKLARLGIAFLGGFEIREVAQPHLQRLRDLTEETSSLHIRIGNHRTCIAQAVSLLPLRRVQEIGALRPLYLGGAGVTLLRGLAPADLIDYLNRAEISGVTRYTLVDRQKLLERVRAVARDGFFINNQESELGVVTVTVPVLDHAASVVAALVVSGPLPRWSPSRVMELLPAIQQVASDIGGDLGGHVGRSPSHMEAGQEMYSALGRG